MSTGLNLVTSVAKQAANLGQTNVQENVNQRNVSQKPTSVESPHHAGTPCSLRPLYTSMTNVLQSGRNIQFYDGVCGSIPTCNFGQSVL
jgi:hypothetical protein